MQEQNDSVWIRRVRRYAYEAFKMLLFLFLMANVISYFRSPRLADEQLPVLSLLTIDGEAVDTAKYAGKPVMVHFWATWCPTCKAELDNIERISKHFPVLSVAVKSGDNAALRTFMQSRGVTFDVVNDSHSLAERFSVAAYPTTFVFDSAGRLAFTEVGYTSTPMLYLRMWLAQ